MEECEGEASRSVRVQAHVYGYICTHTAIDIQMCKHISRKLHGVPDRT